MSRQQHAPPMAMNLPISLSEARRSPAKTSKLSLTNSGALSLGSLLSPSSSAAARKLSCNHSRCFASPFLIACRFSSSSHPAMVASTFPTASLSSLRSCVDHLGPEKLPKARPFFRPDLLRLWNVVTSVANSQSHPNSSARS